MGVRSSENLQTMPVLCFLFQRLSLSLLLSVPLPFFISYFFVSISHHIPLTYIFFLFIHSLSHSLPPTLTFNPNPHSFTPSPHSQSTCQSWLSSGPPLTLQSGSLVLPLERFGLSQRFLSDRAHLATVPGLSSDWGWPDYEGRLPLPS